MGFRVAYGRKIVKCPVCGKLMELDDIDFNFNGNQDEYYYCWDCYTSAFVQVRASQVAYVKFKDESGYKLRK